MTNNTRLRRSMLWAALALLLVPSPACAQWWKASYLKDSSKILELFQEVTSKSQGWTVRVVSNRQSVALGAIVEADGYVLTKASQLEAPVTCKLSDGREFPAKVLGVHQQFDVALLKIDGEDLPCVEWNTDAPQLGRWAVTPGTDGEPLAVGVVSVLPRKIPSDAAFLGVQFADAEIGARIVDVLSDGAAARAGLQAGDVVMQLAGRAIRDGDSLKSCVGELCPGDSLIIRVQRGNRVIDVRAVMGGMMDDFYGQAEKPFLFRIGSPLSLRRSGFPKVMQHDAVLAPQDCGSCVLGIDGRAIGLNIARADRTTTHAIPAADVLPLLEELKSGRLAPPRRGGIVSVRVPAPPVPEAVGGH